MIHRAHSLAVLPRDIIPLLIETALQFFALFIYIYIYIIRGVVSFLGDRSVFDERLTNETSVRDRITKRVFARSKWKMIRGEGKGVFFNPVF